MSSHLLPLHFTPPDSRTRCNVEAHALTGSLSPLLSLPNRMTDLHPLQLPSELIREIRLFVGPHPCAAMIRDFCADIGYDQNGSLIQYMEWYQDWEAKLHLRIVHETMMRLLEDRPDGVYISTRIPPAPWTHEHRVPSTYVGHAVVGSI